MSSKVMLLILVLSLTDQLTEARGVQLESNITEIQNQPMDEQTEVRNVALGASAECSTVFSRRYSCSMAVDGIEECYWSSYFEGVGNWIRLDFGSPRFLTTGRFMQRKHYASRNKDIKLEFSDGSVQQFQLPRRGYGFVWDDIQLAPVNTTWVKITTESVWSTYNNGWTEIQLFARVGKDLATHQVFGRLSQSDYIASCSP